MSAHPHSSAALEGEQVTGKLSERAAAILQAMSVGFGQTDRQVMAALGFTDPNAVRPRITELVQAGLLLECGEVADALTGKTVRLVRRRGALELQRWLAAQRPEATAEQQGELPIRA